MPAGDSDALNARGDKLSESAKHSNRRIDQRARYHAGDEWFAINAREGIEAKLADTARRALAAIEELGKTAQ